MPPKVKRLSAEDTALLWACEALGTACLPEGWHFASLLAETKKPGGCVLAALDENGGLSGFLTACCIAGEGELTTIAVAPAYRRQGIAAYLLRELLAAWGEADVYLEVRQSNAPAIALYRKLGFTEAGVRKRFYTAPEEDAVVMKRGNTNAAKNN